MKKKLLWLIVPLVIIVVGVLLFFAFRALTDVELDIDKSLLIYDENSDWYYMSDSFTGFSGTLKGPTTFIDSIRYEIHDTYDTVVSNGYVSLSEKNWVIKEPGMMLGKNTLNIIVSLTIGKDVTQTITVINTNTDFMSNTNVGIEDTDGDGIIDYLEYRYGTDRDNPDTDGDGLSDYVEISYTGTDPTLYSTEDDGICDADRDSDDDGITNIEEVNIGTDPGCPDTDGDGLNDGEEITVYGTDPLLADTDGDGASDGWEIENDYDPLAYNESFDVSLSLSVDDSAVSAGVELSCKTNPEGLSIEPVSISGLLDETMSGYLGCAYSFSYSEEFSSATIKMTFDTDSISSDAEPAIYYFNEETQSLEKLDTKIEGNTASAVVTHFSTYVLLDSKQIHFTVDADIITPEEAEATVVNVAFVVDYSASMNENDPEYMRLKIVKEYINKLRDGKDYAALVQFAGYATTLVPLTSDMTMVANATDSISNTGSDSCSYDDAGTNGSDGLRHALDELESSGDATHQYIIFLTDGEDTSADYDYEDLVAEAVSHNIVIYTIGMGECDSDLLKSIAESTGGKFHYATAIDHDIDGELSLEDVIDEIAEETVDYYADSNEDGISDYYTRLICDGILTTGTGANPFGDATYEKIQERGSDYDGDGLLNGDEIVITQSGKTVYLKYNSSPVEADTDGDGYTDGDDNRPLLWDVGDRDLAIFAALSYEDGSSRRGKMYTAGDIYGNDDERGESYYFLKFASIAEGGADEAIAKNWVIADYVNQLSGIDHFSATTYKCQDNIIIAYRGTNELLEWVDDVFCYGMLNFHAQEIQARLYAEKIARAYPNSKIYFTGHSLGGYLAQIGAAELLESGSATPERVVYFNGMGINFTDHSGLFNILEPELIKDISLVGKFLHVPDILVLSDFAAPKDSKKLVCYKIRGDVVSSLGTHYGDLYPFDPRPEALENHAGRHGTGSLSEWAGNVLTDILSIIAADDFYTYYDKYGSQSIVEYIWSTHETDSFYYYLDQGTRSGK